MNINQALKLLKEYSCIQIKIPASEREKAELREALLLFSSLCDREILGICADNLEQAHHSLKSYLEAMGYPSPVVSEPALKNREAIYLKYNTQKQSCYVDTYTGNYRGVLIACQTEREELMGTYGHFPLDLFG